MRQTNRSDKEFIQGFAYAVANLARMHDQPTLCRDLLIQSGFELRDFACVDEYDLKDIRRIWRDERINWRLQIRREAARR